MSEKRKANKAFKKGQKYSRQQARNNVPSKYRPMSEPKGCALVILAVFFSALAGLGYAAYLVLT